VSSRRPLGIGIDVGGTKILGLVVAPDGSVLAERRRQTVDGADALIENLAEVASVLAGDGGDRSVDVVSVGVGVPGLVDTDGVLRFAPNLLGASGTAVRDALAERLAASVPPLRCHVQVDNDANCAAAGECAFGAGRGKTDVLFVTLGTGIGGGILSGGRILGGASNFAAEIGHFVVDPQGPPCGCGRRGCWERYASGSGLGRLARDAAFAGRAVHIVALAGGEPEAVRGEHVVRAVAEGDEQAHAILAEFAWWLALGLANLANVLDPQLIVIGGGLVTAGDALLDPVREAFGAQLEAASVRPEVLVLPATLGDRGGAVGAAVLGMMAAGVELGTGPGVGTGPGAGTDPGAGAAAGAG